MGEPQPLTDLQLAILRVLWERDRASVLEITDALRGSRGLAQQTIATILSRLEKRGIVSHTTQQRQYIYRALVSEPDVRRTLLADLTERVFEGDVPALVSQLLSANEMSPGDLARVKAMIADHEVMRGADHVEP
jgi:BlaI family penicillinase repressor